MKPGWTRDRGQILVSGAVSTARALGVSERVVGLTVVSIGTSLPELAVSVAAALRRQQEIAVACLLAAYAGYVAWLAWNPR
jgi:cation:H+ antiporter